MRVFLEAVFKMGPETKIPPLSWTPLLKKGSNANSDNVRLLTDTEKMQMNKDIKRHGGLGEGAR